MTKLSEVLATVERDATVSNVVKAAKDEFADKPFALEYLDTYRIISKWRFVPSILSVCGATLAATTLAPTLSLWYALPVGGFVAGLYELLKAWVSDIGLRAYFKKKGAYMLHLVIGCYLLSVVSSTWGAFRGWELTEAYQVDNVKLHYTNGLDSLNAAHQTRTSEAKEALAKYEQQYTIRSGRYQGQISWEARKDHRALQNEVLARSNEHEAAIREYKSHLPNLVTTAKSDLQPYLYAVIGLSLFVELVIFLFARFLVYYRYKAAKQIEDIEQLASGDVIDLTLENLANMVRGLSMAGLQFLPGAGNQPQVNPVGERVTGNGSNLGFKIGNQSNQPEEQRPHTEPSQERISPVPSKNKIKGKQRGALEARPCDHCGEWYYPYNLPQRFCSKQCNHAHHGFKLK